MCGFATLKTCKCTCVHDVHSPHSADTTCGQSPGGDGGALLHEASDGKPETVAKRVLVDQQVTATLQTGVGVVPLIGCQSGEKRTMELNNRENHRRNAAKKRGGGCRI